MTGEIRVRGQITGSMFCAWPLDSSCRVFPMRMVYMGRVQHIEIFLNQPVYLNRDQCFLP